MSDFSRSGDFGEVLFFDVCIPSGRLRSADRICMAGWHRVNSLYRQERKTGLPFGIMLFTVSGKGKISLNGKEMLTHAGELVLIPQGYSHGYMGTNDGMWEFYWLHYVGEHAALCADDIAAQQTFVFDLGEKMLRTLTSDLFGVKKQSIERELTDSENLTRIMQLLLKRAYRSSSDTAMDEMIRFLENDMDTEFSLETFAKRFHYSKEHIIRLFQKNMGLSPYRYWLRLRLKRSAEALKANDKTIERIAAQCGYSSVSAYSNQFKKLFGMSPGEYRVFCRQAEK